MRLVSGRVVLQARGFHWFGWLPTIKDFLRLLLSPLAGPGSRLWAVRRVLYESVTSASLGRQLRKPFNLGRKKKKITRIPEHIRVIKLTSKQI